MRPDLIIKEPPKPIPINVYLYIVLVLSVFLVIYVLYYKHNNRLPKNILTLNELFDRRNK